jgi:prevent-host-death family protein
MSQVQAHPVDDRTHGLKVPTSVGTTLFQPGDPVVESDVDSSLQYLGHVPISKMEKSNGAAAVLHAAAAGGVVHVSKRGVIVAVLMPWSLEAVAESQQADLVVTTRDFCRETSKIMASVVDDGRPVVVTRKGQIVARVASVNDAIVQAQLFANVEAQIGKITDEQ